MIDTQYDKKHIKNIPDGGIFIPSRAKDPDIFEQNVEKLKTLSNSTWCTKSYMADRKLIKSEINRRKSGI